MSIFFFKSLLSIVIIFLAISAMLTMFEILGRNEKKYDIEKLKKLHKANGIAYFLVFIFISYFCISFIISSKSELTPRSTFHSIFAFTIIVLFGLKISFIRIYRQFYSQVKMLGLLIALITFGLAGTSGVYYLIATKFGTDKVFEKIIEYKRGGLLTEKKGDVKIVIKTDQKSISKGKELYESKCYFCHNAYSTKWEVGPGHKGIMKNPLLPVSKKPATPENIANQLRNPYKDMPPFSYLSDKDIQNIIAFLNTL